MTPAELENLFQGMQYRTSLGQETLTALHGANWDTYRSEWDAGNRFEERSFPVHLDFELNHSCNLRCVFCYWSQKEFAATASRDVFPLDAFERIMAESVPLGLRSVNLENNNEPLLNPDLPLYVAAAREAGVLDVMFHTNGHLLSPEISAKLMDAGLTRIFVSLDAFSPKTYEAMRGGGKNGYEKVVRNIHSLLDLRVRRGQGLPMITLCFLRSSINAHELEDFKRFWSKQVECVHAQMYQDFTAPALRAGKPGETPSRCAQPMVRMAVRVDGTVQPCCSFFGYSRYVVGNILNTPVKEIWGSPKVSGLRTLMRQGRLAENPICRECSTTWDACSTEAS